LGILRVLEGDVLVNSVAAKERTERGDADVEADLLDKLVVNVTLRPSRPTFSEHLGDLANVAAAIR
jgi:hypothetical protein